MVLIISNFFKKLFLKLISIKIKFQIIKADLPITFCEFKKAFEDNNYPPPTEQQYKSFSSQMVSKGDIQTKREAGMFLSQLLHESGGLKFKKELGN